MFAPAHRGTPDTLPCGSWCIGLSLSNGMLAAHVAYRCPGCGLIKALFGSTVADDGTVSPALTCGPCGTTKVLKLEHWDPDPC